MSAVDAVLLGEESVKAPKHQGGGEGGPAAPGRKADSAAVLDRAQMRAAVDRLHRTKDQAVEVEQKREARRRVIDGDECTFAPTLSSNPTYAVSPLEGNDGNTGNTALAASTTTTGTECTAICWRV